MQVSRSIGKVAQHVAQASAPVAGATSAKTAAASQQKTSVPAVRAAALAASKKPQGERSTASLGSAVPASSAEQKCAKSGSVQLAHAVSASAKSAPQQGAKSAGVQPLQERNTPSHGAAAPAKPFQQTGAYAHLLRTYSGSHLLLRLLCRQDRLCDVLCGRCSCCIGGVSRALLCIADLQDICCSWGASGDWAPLPYVF